MTNNVPNLDCMDHAELMLFWAKHQRGRKSRNLGLSGKGSRNATSDLAEYAANKATAMLQRNLGNVAIALSYESICDRIYDNLPDCARW